MKYYEMTIQCALTLREMFTLTLRATQGFLLSLIKFY
ncbi:transposase [Methylomarinum vadi]